MRIELIFAIIFVATGCRTTIVAIDSGQKTALERQLMGQFEPLTDEQALASSVRAAPDSTDLTADAVQARATFARQRQLFNRDDVEDLKGLGCLGEAVDARLAARPCAATKEESTRVLAAKMITEENADRAMLLDWVAAGHEAAAPAGRAQLATLYHHLLVNQSRAGDWFEEPAGAWQKK
jgi:hypothetical protein